MSSVFSGGRRGDGGTEGHCFFCRYIGAQLGGGKSVYLCVSRGRLTGFYHRLVVSFLGAEGSLF